MAVAIKSIEEYTIKRGKRSFWMCFNIAYNEIQAYGNTTNYDCMFDVDKKHTDIQAREEFLNFMKENFPNIQLENIFDCWGSEWLEFPYLKSIAIDCDEGDEVYRAIDERYSDKSGAPKSSSAVFWYIDLEVAQRIQQQRNEALAGEFDLDD